MVKHYSNYSAFLDDTLNTERVQGASTQSVDNRPQFSSGFTYSQSVELAKTGWPEGREKIRQMSALISVRIANREHRQQVNFDVCGDTIDIGRAVMGIPESFMVWEETEADKVGTKIIKIVVSGSVSAAIPSDVIEARGAAICALVECLEIAGFRCEVIFSKCFGGDSFGLESCEATVVVKESTAPIQFDQLAFALVHPGSFRRIAFKWLESCAGSVGARLTTRNYGHPKDSSLRDEANIYIPKMLSAGDVRDFQTPKAVEDWIIRQLALQGVHLEEE